MQKNHHIDNSSFVSVKIQTYWDLIPPDLASYLLSKPLQTFNYLKTIITPEELLAFIMVLTGASRTVTGGRDVKLTFDCEIHSTAFFSCIVDDLTGVLSSMGSVHVVKLQNHLVVLQGEAAVLPWQYLLGSSEPLQGEGHAALHHAREGHVGARHGLHRLQWHHERWRFWARRKHPTRWNQNVIRKEVVN